jgi:hypothetical protein
MGSADAAVTVVTVQNSLSGGHLREFERPTVPQCLDRATGIYNNTIDFVL